MRICLDTSVLNRPFDDQTQSRIVLETQALQAILQLIEMGEIELVSSAVLAYENSRNRSLARRRWVEQCLGLAGEFQTMNEAVIQRAAVLESQGLKPVDALHVACSEMAGCDYFLTCDDRLIRRYGGGMQVVNPVSFVLDITREDA